MRLHEPSFLAEQMSKSLRENDPEHYLEDPHITLTCIDVFAAASNISSGAFPMTPENGRANRTSCVPGSQTLPVIRRSLTYTRISRQSG